MKQCEHGHFYDETRFAACPYCRDGAAGAGGSEGTAGKTVAVLRSGSAPSADEGKTVGIIQKKIGIDPAVGFLICIEGPDRGADYRLVAGRNFIGRLPSMDVALTADDTVSRDGHALVTYDAKYNRFSCCPARAGGLPTATANRWSCPGSWPLTT